MKFIICAILLFAPKLVLAVCLNPSSGYSNLEETIPNSTACTDDSECAVLGCSEAYNSNLVKSIEEQAAAPIVINRSTAVHDENGVCIQKARCENKTCVLEPLPPKVPEVDAQSAEKDESL